ncbi:hypothetical protein COU17_00030 [Candidatus Kaiserbacteria bacterium CG10_big_fil_rev_8_21_14_0_10_49_17]|uniref:Ada DNA repair metal-binding domain-containing protein n=1 Tax=Candidatus Kaiserbacteria bacterium CG10_big_fil_rev_8_21_14_0_10_49_17 TaxID=1974609 RepID=A0A2M6WFD7_9BACT|nr:MAG: hypothetical protein COU17_00030 [Candidatus Kaiserbacteria bacterium CG10_big_fil_rev_8_21_14_0_10_49_17]
MGEKIKSFEPLLLILAIILVGTAGFGLGRLSVLETATEPVWIEYPEGYSGEDILSASAARAPEIAGGEVVASKNGSKYHYPWCSGAKRIAEKNLITFSSITEARAAGYEPAANCKGLQ